MSHTMIGANVEELDSLANNMSQSAEKLVSMCSALRALPRGVWKGTDAAQFFQELDSSLIPQTNAVATALSAASNTLSANAAAQRETSNTLDGGGSAGVREGSVGSSTTPSGTDQDAIESDLLQKIIGLGGDLLKDGSILGGGVKFFGAGVDLFDTLRALGTGDLDDILFNVGKLGLNAVKMNPGVGTLVGVGLDLFEGYVPIGSGRAQELEAFTKQRLYGTASDGLSAEQIHDYSQRYEGPLGGGRMVYDSILESSANADNVVWSGINYAGEGAADLIWNAGNALGDFIWDSGNALGDAAYNLMTRK